MNKILEVLEKKGNFSKDFLLNILKENKCQDIEYVKKNTVDRVYAVCFPYSFSIKLEVLQGGLLRICDFEQLN